VPGKANRLHRALDDTGIKLDCIATDILGVSGRSLLDARVKTSRSCDAPQAAQVQYPTLSCFLAPGAGLLMVVGGKLSRWEPAVHRSVVAWLLAEHAEKLAERLIASGAREPLPVPGRARCRVILSHDQIMLSG